MQPYTKAKSKLITLKRNLIEFYKEITLNDNSYCSAPQIFKPSS